MVPEKRFTVPEVLCVQMVPSGDVSTVPEAPTATNCDPAHVTFVRELAIPEATVIQTRPGSITMKSTVDVACPPAVLTVIGPVAAPAGTRQTSFVKVASTTTARTPLNRTVFETGLTIKLAPKISTVVPTRPLSGLNPLRIGGGGLVVNDHEKSDSKALPSRSRTPVVTVAL